MLSKKIAPSARRPLHILFWHILFSCPPGGEVARGDAEVKINFGCPYPKSFRIWSFQTGVAMRFQGVSLKLSHLEEILVRSWKLGAEFGILAVLHKGSPLYTNSSAWTEPFKDVYNHVF